MYAYIVEAASRYLNENGGYTLVLVMAVFLLTAIIINPTLP